MAKADSLLPVAYRWKLVLEENTAEEKAIDNRLEEIESGNTLSQDKSKVLSDLLAIRRSNAAIRARKRRSRLYEDIARAATRLRLYSLAARAWYNAWKDEVLLPTDSSLYNTQKVTESTPAPLDSLLTGFEDGKTPQFYALLVHVKQPRPGKRKTFTHLNNVGHTFITLVKYNTDGSSISRSFGFYPHKSSLLAATPFHPTAPSVFKDDARHEWDETVGKFISAARFEEIVGRIRSFDHRNYHLNHNNCTSFGLTVAQIGGIGIQEAVGRWPFGKGENPGSAGQSLLEGKFRDDTDSPDGLFVLDNVYSSR